MISRQKTTDFVAECFSTHLECYTDSPRSKISTRSNARQIAGACIAGWKLLGKLSCIGNPHHLLTHCQTPEIGRHQCWNRHCSWKKGVGMHGQAFREAGTPFTAVDCTSVLLEQPRRTISLQSCASCQGELTTCLDRLWGSKHDCTAVLMNCTKEWIFTLTF